MANPYATIAAADVVVLSSRWEGFPNALLESMALNQRIICAIVTGVKSFFEQASIPRGLCLFELDSVQSFNGALVTALKINRSQIDYSDFLNQFDIAQVANQYISVLCRE
ncbi:MAG: glycosyltransferase [Marinagarivorans sp.]|nr:glycosyltransferase [Marinagarivorans sp.]